MQRFIYENVKICLYEFCYAHSIWHVTGGSGMNELMV